MDINLALNMYEMMVKIRAFEEEVMRSSEAKLFHGTTHLYIGQEAVATGVCAHLSDEDYITSTHRSHGHAIAKGLDVDKVMAEIFGKRGGSCKGKGGSMHIADSKRGHLGSNGVVAANIPIAVGAALTLKLEEKSNVVVCFFGDGAINEGAFHEAMNLAAIWSLPIIFVCENNGYGMSTKISDVTNLEQLKEVAKSYNMTSYAVDGNDLEAVYVLSDQVISEVREGSGPVFIEARTYRYAGHSRSDQQVYRSKDEVIAWKDRDPIALFEEKLQGLGVSQIDLLKIRSKVKENVDQALVFAMNSEEPSLEELKTDLYAERVD